MKTIKSIISLKLDQQQRKAQFERKFGLSPALQSARAKLGKHNTTFIGETQQEQDEEKLNLFLIEHRSAVKLEQQARLT